MALVDNESTKGNGNTNALVLSELNGPFELREIQLGELRPDEVIVKMIATGVCHTDVASATGDRPPDPPSVLGHEGSGEVLTVGSAITHVSPGDKVILSFNYCGNCAPCLRGTPSYCVHSHSVSFGGRRFDGSSPVSLDGKPISATYFGQSSFSQRMIVRGVSCVKVPDSTPLDILCCLGCGVQTGAGTVLNILTPRVGSSVAVFGVGSVGLAGIMAARNQTPATKVIAIDIQQSRLDLARELGATHTVNSKTEDVLQRLKEITNGEGVDYAMDATGLIKVIEDMIASAANNAIVATVGGANVGQFVHIEAAKWIGRNVSYVGSCQGSAVPRTFIPAMIEWHQTGRFPVDRLVTKYSYKDINTAIHDMHMGKTIKPVLLWD